MLNSLGDGFQDFRRLGHSAHSFRLRRLSRYGGHPQVTFSQSRSPFRFSAILKLLS